MTRKPVYVIFVFTNTVNDATASPITIATRELNALMSSIHGIVVYVCLTAREIELFEPKRSGI